MPALLPIRRSTRQNNAIRCVLAEAGRPLLPTEILIAAQAIVPSLGMATVYRNLKQLTEDGDVQVVELPGESPRYELCGAHHHHFLCHQCQRVFDIDTCPGDLQKIAPPGFTVADHDLTLYGTCPQCAPAPAAEAASPGGPVDAKPRSSAKARPGKGPACCTTPHG